MADAYTTITVTEYVHMRNTILRLREKLQKARECLEKDLPEAALGLLVQEREG